MSGQVFDWLAERMYGPGARFVVLEVGPTGAWSWRAKAERRSDRSVPHGWLLTALAKLLRYEPDLQ